jgi:two-component system CheB/CheR fusion protein
MAKKKAPKRQKRPNAPAPGRARRRRRRPAPPISRRPAPARPDGDHELESPRPETGRRRQSPPELQPIDAFTEHDNDNAAARLKADFSIVAVGASAGGLEAFKQLLSALPPNPAMAIVFIQHLSPTHESALPELLAGSSPIPVVQVTEAMPVEPNRVHVIPPSFHMSIASDGTFHLVPRPTDRTQHMPIDAFFRSLAEHAQGNAVGVVLSGTSSDGAAGLLDIKAVGGITLAQDPRTAKYDGMPRAAIATGAVDVVLAPGDIALDLIRITRHPFVRHLKPRRPADDLAMPDEQLHRIFAMLRVSTGVDFTHYKQPTIRRRLQRRMVLHKVVSLEQYIKFLQQKPDEVQALYSDILIHVTRFFREPESFNALSEIVFPACLTQRRGDEPIRIWVPGCATGEEAYSVAICLLEFLGEKTGTVPVQVFATDVSEPSVDFARAGVYADNITQDVSPERLRRFFARTDGHYRISKTVRDLCVFARQDLTRDPPFSRLDLVLCRNVLIYLGAVLQKKVMSVFHYALKPNGYLILGAAETVGPNADLFTVADKHYRLFTKKPGSMHGDVAFAPRDHDRRGVADDPAVDRLPVAAAAAEIPRPVGGVQHQANRIILDRYSPPGVLVNNDMQIVQFRGQTGRYLEPAPGEASLNVVKMAREGLLHGLRSAIAEARNKNTPARREGLRVKHNGHIRDVAVDVVPLEGTPDGRYYLILFDDRTAPLARPADAPADAPATIGKNNTKSGRPAKGARTSATAAAERDSSRVIRLEEELRASREYLQSIIQDLEAANEELQSANEEILSSNEELQSTNEELDTAKEELQSTNEELNTVNEELHNRNEELTRVNSDLVNLLGSVQIAIVMVSGDLRIRRFTPAAEKVLNLIPTDVGRPIGDIKPNVECPDLERLITDAIDRVATVEREVADRNGRFYLLRIRPYKSLENRIDGAVLALLDSEGQSQGATDDRLAREFTDTLVELTREPTLVLDSDLRVARANTIFYRTFGVTPEQTEGQAVYDLGNGQWDIPALRSLLEEILPRDSHFEDFEVTHDFPGLGRRTMRINARRVRAGDGRQAMIVLVIQEIKPAPPEP